MVVRAAQAGVESLALEVLARSVQVAPGEHGGHVGVWRQLGLTLEAFPKPQDSMGQRHCWVELSGFGADCKDAVLEISGREMGNTMERWGLIYFFLLFTPLSCCSRSC